jgi:Flp pilus assembly protein TadD
VIGVTAATILLARVWPAGLIVWAHHIIVLGPVSGIAHSGPQLTADRFSYLAGPAWALLAGAGAGVLARVAQRRGPRAKLARLATVGVGVWLAVLGAMSWQQTQVWRTTETLWQAALSQSPDCAICHTNLGTWLMSHGQPVAGAAHLERAAALRPDQPMAFGWLGQAYAQLGRLPEAIAAYREELALRPHMDEARIGLGAALIRAGRPAEAVPELRDALTRSPHAPAARTNLGIALLELGRARDAVPELLAAVELSPRDGVPRLALADAYLSLGEPARAREQYDALRELDPGLAARVGPRLDRVAPRR